MTLITIVGTNSYNLCLYKWTYIVETFVCINGRIIVETNVRINMDV